MPERTIKFRGKRKGGIEWLYGDLNHIEGNVFIMPRTEDTPTNSPDWFEVVPETVGQFLGLRDVKGEDIYEGDVLEYIVGARGHETKIRQVVIWYVDGFKFNTTKPTIKKNYLNQLIVPTPRRANYNEWYKSTVIGNIYEHPDLIQ